MQIKENPTSQANLMMRVPLFIDQYLLFFSSYDPMAISLLNDNCGFHIHARHMYVLPRGCAHDENISHPDYTQVFH